MSLVSLSPLVSGYATPFFNLERCLKKYFPLSPLLFLLVVEGLRRMVISSHKFSAVEGIKTARFFSFTHLIFKDEILVFVS